MHLLLLRIQLFSFPDHQRYIFLTETFFRCLFESTVQYDKKILYKYAVHTQHKDTLLDQYRQLRKAFMERNI